MKDSYSFDRDEDGLEVSFRAHEGAYHRIFERCGIEYFAVQAESGMMGGSESIDFLAPSGSGENTLVTCENGDYAADLEIARGVPRAPEFPERLDAPEEVETPGITTIEALAELPRHRPGRDLEGDAGDEGRRHGRARARPRRRPARGGEARSARSARTFRPATEDEIARRFGADPGSLGPVGFEGEIVADETLREGQFVAGANRTGWHLRGVEQGRDFARALRRHPRSRRRATPARSAAARSASRPRSRSATSSSSARATRCRSGATFLDEDGEREAARDGELRHRPRPRHGGRGRAAPRRDGIVWPAAIAPYDVHVVVLGWARRAGADRRGGRRASLSAAGRRAARRPRAAAGREVRRRRPDRLPDPGHRRQEDARGRAVDVRTGAGGDDAGLRV